MNEKSSEETSSEIKTKGFLVEKGVEITERNSIDALSSRGYGTTENEIFRIAFYEALYLIDKELLEVIDEHENPVDFQNLLRRYHDIDDNAWVKYLIYRDLRNRGYVVREGFGIGTDFRIYERGAYGKDTAQYLILSIQEGKPLPVRDLTNALRQCQSQKKEMIIAVMNRRGETVYYSVSPLTFK